MWASQVYTVPADNQNDYFSWSSPSYSDATGLVYIGISSECDMPFVPSGVKAYDETTGALRASYSTMPDAGRPGLRRTHDPTPPSTNYVGAGVWTTAPAVTSSGVYVTTGSTYDDTNAEHPPTDANDFDQYSVFKLDPSTLAKTGKFAAPTPADIGDPDWGSGAVMFRAAIDGTSVEMAGACNKDGNFYALADRHDAAGLGGARRTRHAVRRGRVPERWHLGRRGPLRDRERHLRRRHLDQDDADVLSGYSWPLYVPSGGTAALERDAQARPGDRARRVGCAPEADLGGGEPPPGARHVLAQRPGHPDRVPDHGLGRHVQRRCC